MAKKSSCIICGLVMKRGYFTRKGPICVKCYKQEDIREDDDYDEYIAPALKHGVRNEDLGLCPHGAVIDDGCELCVIKVKDNYEHELKRSLKFRR